MGGLKQVQKGNVDFRIAFIFGIPALLSVSMRAFIPIIPDELFVLNDVLVARRMGMFWLFALVMIPAAFAMVKTPTTTVKNSKLFESKYNYYLMVIEGAIGVLRELLVLVADS